MTQNLDRQLIDGGSLALGGVVKVGEAVEFRRGHELSQLFYVLQLTY
jgi:hypothetical protein